MEVSSKFHAIGNLPTRKGLLLHIEQGVIWAPELVWMLGRREISFLIIYHSSTSTL
jgi:hypothetical protein